MLQKSIICDWPISFLQDNLYGIMTGDLIMLAASTGVGKSTISRIIMQSAIAQGVPVVLYSLEDEPGTFAADNHYRQYIKMEVAPLPYRRWLVDRTRHPERYADTALKAAELEMQTTEDGIPLVQVHEMKTPNWTIDELIEQMKIEQQLGYKLFIIDHMDILVPSESPADTTRAMNELWQFVAQQQLAVITFSQLASGRNKDALCPSISDLRGSKNKVNTPTIVLSIARHNYGFYSDSNGKPTYLRILKNRQGGDVKCGIVYFHRGCYSDFYQEVPCNESGTTIDGETMKSLTTRMR